MNPEAQLARAERALSEGDVESALDALITFAERRASSPVPEGVDARFDYLFEATIEVASL